MQKQHYIKSETFSKCVLSSLLRFVEFEFRRAHCVTITPNATTTNTKCHSKDLGMFLDLIKMSVLNKYI